MFRTVKVKLAGNIEPLVHTATMYTQACQLALDYGFKNKTHNKNKINAGTYVPVREKIPRLPSGLVQCARDQAAEMLKRERCRRLSTKKKMQIRYDKRTFKFYPESGYVSLSTIMGRLNFPVRLYEYVKQYIGGEFTNAQLLIRKNGVFLNVQCQLPDTERKTGRSVLGIDRGIMNIVTCSDNSFANSSHLRKVKGHYQYLKAKLQSIGTASAGRKLKKLSGAERRFTLDVNHVIAKEIVQKPYDVFAVEALRIGRRKKIHGRRFNRMLGGWSYGQLLTMLTYKSENIGKRIVQVNPRHTSQRCSKCGYIDKQNRKGLKFKCKQCSFELNADLNAARNIGEIGKSELVRLSVNQPIVAHTAATSPQALAVGS